MNRRSGSAAVVIALAAVGLGHSDARATSPAATTVRVSVRSDGIQDRWGRSEEPSISDDGRTIVFTSHAILADTSYTANCTWHPDCYPEYWDQSWTDHYPWPQVYVHDLLSATTRLGAFGPNESRPWDYYNMYADSVSGNGRVISFNSGAKHLVSPPTETNANGYSDQDVFTKDGSGPIVDQSRSGSLYREPYDSWDSVLSHDGRTVAFMSGHPLMEQPSNGATDIYVHGPSGLRRASVRPQGGSFSSSASPDISSSGTTVVFQASEYNSATGTSTTNVYVHDGTAVTLVSKTPSGTPANDAFEPYISGDGRFVAFSSSVVLAPGALAGQVSGYVFDRGTGTTSFITSIGTGSVSDISEDGRYIVFDSRRSDLVPGDTNQWSDVFVLDRAFGTTERVSVATGGTQANGPSEGPSVSADGRTIVFQSAASNLVAGDTQGETDVFAHQRPAQPLPPDADHDGVGDWRDLCSGTGARLRVDSNGCEVPVPGQPIPPELRGIEVTQAVQDWSNSARLVQGKDTIVRLHFTRSPDLVPASGSLRGTRDGIALGSVTPLNHGGSVAPATDQLAGRAHFARSLNFRLPASWTQGTVTLTFDGVGRCEEADQTPWDCETTVTFDAGLEPRIALVGFSWSDGTTTHDPTSSLNELVGRLTAAWPVARVDASIQVRPWPLTGAPRMEDALQVLRTIRSADGLTGSCDRCLYYGAFVGPTATRGAFDAASGVAAGVTPSTAFDVERNRHVTLLTRALGLPAALDGTLAAAPGQKVGHCGERGTTGDPDFASFASLPGVGIRPVLGPLDVPHSAAFGLETRLVGTTDEPLAVVDPFVTFELTSACVPTRVAQGRWTSLASYAGIHAALQARFSPSPPPGDIRSDVPVDA